MPYTSPEDWRIKRYIRSIYYDVEDVFKGTAIPIKLVLAMTAQDTGWGVDIRPGTKNIFNIKASEAWRKRGGKEVVVKNIEEFKIVDGEMIRYFEEGGFRIYASQRDSIEDLLQFLEENGGYSEIFKKENAGKIINVAKELQVAGYATGPRKKKVVWKDYNNIRLNFDLSGSPLKDSPRVSVSYNAYSEKIIQIAMGDRLKDALRGLPSRDELEEKLLEKFCNELEYDFTLPGYRGQAIERKEFAKTIRAYVVNVCHQGDKVAEISPDNLEPSFKISLTVTYIPGKKGQPDLLRIDYRVPGGIKKIAWWNIDKNKFVEIPSGYNFRR